MTRPAIALLDGGTYYHHFALNDPMVLDRVAGLVPLRGLEAADLEDFSTVVVSCRSNPDQLVAVAPALLTVLERGDRLVVMGETEPRRWLPHIQETPLPTNFWWWLEPGADLGLSVVAPDHPLFQHVDLATATWHYHGMFTVPDGATSLIDCTEGGSILYEDQVTWPGTLVVTSLDPIYHHGSFFMPTASRFLDGLIAWLAKG